MAEEVEYEWRTVTLRQALDHGFGRMVMSAVKAEIGDGRIETSFFDDGTAVRMFFKEVKHWSADTWEDADVTLSLGEPK